MKDKSNSTASESLNSSGGTSGKTGSGGSGRKKSEKKSKSGQKVYQFHADYLKNAPPEKTTDGGRRRSKSTNVGAKKQAHPEADNDEFWERRYRIVNYRKRFPDAFDQDEFDSFYEWLGKMQVAGGDPKEDTSKTILFR